MTVIASDLYRHLSLSLSLLLLLLLSLWVWPLLVHLLQHCLLHLLTQHYVVVALHLNHEPRQKLMMMP